MAIAFDASSTGSVNPGTSLTVSHVVGSGSNRALVVSVTAGTTDIVTGVTHNGTAMTQVNKRQHTGARFVYLYYLNAPATGTFNIVASQSASGYLELSAASYTGVKQTGQPEANAVNSGASVVSLTTSVTTITDNAWTVLAAQHQAGTVTAGSGSTKRTGTLVNAVMDSNGVVTPAGSNSMTFNGLDTSSPCACVIAALAPTDDAITITTPSQYKVFQRSGSTGSIAVTGTYTGSPTAIEASFNGGAYATIDAAPAGGTYSGSLTSQAQGQGTLTVRFTNDTGISATKADIGIGDVFVVAGDSIAEGRGTNAQSYTHATLKAAKFNQSDVFAAGNDPIDIGTTNGSHWPLLATQIMASQSVPVQFISVGTGGTDVAGSANTWAKNNTEYAAMVTQVTDSGTNGIKGVLMHLGPNAVVNASTLTKATYNTALDTLATNIAADLVGAPKLNVGIFGEVSTGSPPDRTAALNNLRAAIIEAHGDNANIEPGPCLIDLDYSDGVHPVSDAQLTTLANRWWVALAETYYGGSGGRGPRLSSSTWNVARDELTVVFDRTLKTGLTFSTACWAVSDNGTPMTVSSVAYHGSNVAALVITTSAAAVGAADTTTVTFASGDTAVGVVVPLSTDITMPSGAAIQIPAEPIYAAAVAETIDSPLHGRSLRGMFAFGRMGSRY